MSRTMVELRVLLVIGWCWVGNAFVSIPSAMAFQAAGDSPALLKIGEERIAPDEAATIEKLVQLQLTIMKAKADGKRGQHGKDHGCVEAEFSVSEGIPAMYRVGVFANPKTFKAMIRYSNGASPKDNAKDVHGMAVKIFEVDGRRSLENDARAEQDFIFIDSDFFFARDAKVVFSVMEARWKEITKVDPDAMKKLAAIDLDTVKLFAMSAKQIASPLTSPYFSAVPYRCGEGAVKYMVRPASGNGPQDAKPSETDENFLKKAMVDHLTVGKNTAVFEFYIIPQTDPKNMLIEDPTKPWDSEPIRVATITIRPQEFDTEARRAECEKMSFDAWHALSVHQPLGGVNRARKAVYPASLEARRKAAP